MAGPWEWKRGQARLLEEIHGGGVSVQPLSVKRTYGVLMRPGIWQASGPTEEQQWLPERKTKEHSPYGGGKRPPLGVCVKEH